MSSLYSIAEEIEPGDYLAWIASSAWEGTGERTTPKKVTDVEDRGSVIRIYGEGVRGGEYYFDVGPDGDSEAIFVNGNTGKHEPMGTIEFAELTETQEPVRVRDGYFNSRKG